MGGIVGSIVGAFFRELISQLFGFLERRQRDALQSEIGALRARTLGLEAELKLAKEYAQTILDTARDPDAVADRLAGGTF